MGTLFHFHIFIYIIIILLKQHDDHTAIHVITRINVLLV
jgi:hypothetical protein